MIAVVFGGGRGRGVLGTGDGDEYTRLRSVIHNKLMNGEA